MSDEAGTSENPVEAAAQTQRLSDAAKKAVDKAKASPWTTAGVGAAVGSAAVVAAMLYFGRNNGKKKGDDA